ncbi:MAG: HAD family hydrolase [Patescibacteria group bacterium]
MKTKQKTAIFDIDGTLFRSSLLIELVEGLIENNIFPPEVRKKFQDQKKDWIERNGSYEDYINAVIEAFTQNIKGVPYAKFMEIGEAIVEEQRWRTYTYTRSLLKSLKEKDYYLLAISQSPKGILDRFCSNFGFDKVYGRIYELGPEDRFTGEVEELHLIANKANIVKRAKEKEDLDLKNSIGVGDTEGDISFLEMIDHPICFNPNKNLYRHALRNGWNIIVERKDVIYEIKKRKADLDIIDPFR